MSITLVPHPTCLTQKLTITFSLICMLQTIFVMPVRALTYI